MHTKMKTTEDSPSGFGNRDNDFLFHFGDHANIGTGIPLEGLVTSSAFNSSPQELSVPLIPLYG